MTAQVIIGLAVLVGLLAVLPFLPRSERERSLREEIERENLAQIRRHALFAPPPHAHDGRLEETWVR